jgi:hypothetical protein
MTITIPQLDLRNLRRRAISSVTLLAYLACAIGFPMPDAAANACGQTVCCCGTAEQCQSSGCGCTPAPKIEVPSCCSKKAEPVKASCCENKSLAANATDAKPKTIRWVVGMSAQKCRGGQSNWVSADVALPGPPPADWQPSWPYCHSLPIDHVHSPFHLEAPRDPPPRSV